MYFYDLENKAKNGLIVETRYAIIQKRPKSQCWLSGYFVRGVNLVASIVKRSNSYSIVYMTTVQDQRKQKWETFHSLNEAEQKRKSWSFAKEPKCEKEGNILILLKI